MENLYDIIIIGSGAGGGTIARALSHTPARILILERGNFIPREPDNWDPEAVWKHLRYRTTETWMDSAGEEFVPYTHYCVGGNTKFWGSVLYRLRKEDFEETKHADGISPAWPIDYETLEPYYEKAERLYQVHGESGLDPTEPPRGPFPHPPIAHSEEIEKTIKQLIKRGLHPSPLPLGLLNPGEPNGCILCNTCNSFPCLLHAKSEADICCIRPILEQRNITLWTNALAKRLSTDPTGQRIQIVEVDHNGQNISLKTSLVIISCGAVNSAALLLRSVSKKHPNGLANSSGLVGKHYMAHLSTMMQGFKPFKKNLTIFQKTVAINDFYLKGPDTSYPLGQIQSQGRTHGVMAKTVVPWVPLWAYNAWVARGVDWLAMTEDLPQLNNRIIIDGDGRIRLHYRPSNFIAHARLVTEMKRILKSLGFWKVVTYSHGIRNTTHQCGTLRFGSNPRESVLDSYCRTHDIENLFVVDASFFPSSAAVNPGLTIIAQALRVADHIIDTDLRSAP